MQLERDQKNELLKMLEFDNNFKHNLKKYIIKYDELLKDVFEIFRLKFVNKTKIIE